MKVKLNMEANNFPADGEGRKMIPKGVDFEAEIEGRQVLTIKTCLIIVLIVVAILSVPIIISSGHTHFKHALEWDYFLGVLLFYLLNHFFWLENPGSHT